MKNKDIIELREKVGEAMGRKCSQEKFGALLDVSWRTVNRWEKGPIRPDDGNIKKLESLVSIIDDDEKKEEIIPYLKMGNMIAVGSVIALVSATLSAAPLLALGGGIAGLSKLITKLTKDK
jgi:ribosome-binding protein aMBF1 (putative translation factor)